MASLAHVGTLRSALADLEPSKTAAHIWLSEGPDLLIGNFPTPTHRFDFATERLVTVGNQATEPKKRVSLLGNSRRTGRLFELETPDAIYTVGSATWALITGLEIIESQAPGTLKKLAQKNRSKSPVAESLEDLYDLPSQRKYAHKMRNGFYVATNNKANEALGILNRAKRIAEVGEGLSVREVKG